MSKIRNPKVTHANLMEAAKREFRDKGYENTDSNKIASRAGYSPQTFYRHFSSKEKIFEAVYKKWVEDSILPLREANTVEEFAARFLAENASMKLFRRSLRLLTHNSLDISKVRAEERHVILNTFVTCEQDNYHDIQQIEWLMTLDRWLDAMIEGELTALGVSDTQAFDHLIEILARYGKLRSITTVV
jgi:AcrR family transcriptional regulator